MLARYPGPCRKCGVTISKGEECKYDASTKTIEHFSCVDDKPAAKPEALAERLHFKPHEEASQFPWSTLRNEPERTLFD